MAQRPREKPTRREDPGSDENDCVQMTGQGRNSRELKKEGLWRGRRAHAVKVLFSSSGTGIGMAQNRRGCASSVDWAIQAVNSVPRFHFAIRVRWKDQTSRHSTRLADSAAGRKGRRVLLRDVFPLRQGSLVVSHRERTNGTPLFFVRDSSGRLRARRSRERRLLDL